MSRASDLCGRHDYCPSGDCDVCSLPESDEMYEAEYLDSLEELLNEPWFKGTEEQKDRILDMAEASISDLNEETLIGAIWLASNSSIEDVREAVGRIS